MISFRQFLSRSLMAQEKKTTAMKITRTYALDKKLGMRKRRLQLLKENPPEAEPCYKALIRSENRCNQPRLKLMIEECLDDPCGMEELPMDLDHYTPSDKKKRKYQRTWCECYVLPNKFVQMKKCYPNRPRRKLARSRTKVDCVEATNVKAAGRRKPEKLVDIKRSEWPCCKIVAPGCKPARADPSCKQIFPPSCCKKRRTQYPSFSECKPVGLLDPIPPCECEKTANLCDVWAYWRRFYDK
ncbi:uncharacterized protein [Drosophila kikkawai]|uniref:Uncharacterized protein n=1 Tax=Drosophila kikkawai TaxID=30033 RepID=A0A6P4ILR2_DROKI|nr:uncharacterized protein LOC108076218 [Drosophila kikkawai]